MNPLLVSCLFLVTAWSGRERDEAAFAQRIAPLLDSATILVARVKLERLTTDDAVRFVDVLGLVSTNDVKTLLQRRLEPIFAQRNALMRAGGRELYVVLGLSPTIRVSASLPFSSLTFAVWAEAPDQAAAVAEVVRPLALSVDDKHKVQITKGQLIVCGTAETLAKLDPSQPPRPELSEIFALQPAAPLHIALLMNDMQRRLLAEMMPNLPAAWGGGPVQVLTDGFRWVSIALYCDQPRIHLLVQSANEAAARAAEAWLRARFRDLTATPEPKGLMASLAAAENLLLPLADQDQLRLTLRADDVALKELFAELQRQFIMNMATVLSGSKMRQIIIAMHNYHNDQGKLPGQAILDKNGKPLLSWRVALLPYIEGGDLYRQFKLDEPWDSPHNIKLLAQMPTAYQRPPQPTSLLGSLLEDQAKMLRAENPDEPLRAAYLVPLMPGAVFAAEKPLTLGRVSAGDGTSNTIFLVEVSDAHAVPWTKPEDWRVSENEGARALFGCPKDLTNVAFGDGSVRRMKRSVPFDILAALVGWNDSSNKDLSQAFEP